MAGFKAQLWQASKLSIGRLQNCIVSLVALVVLLLLVVPVVLLVPLIPLSNARVVSKCWQDFLDERAPSEQHTVLPSALTSWMSEHQAKKTIVQQQAKKQTAPPLQGLDGSPFTLDWTLLGLTGWRLKLNSTLLQFYLN